LIFDNGTNVGIGNTNTSYTFDVTGTGRFTGSVFGDVGFRTKSLNGYLLKNDADSANLGGLVRRSYWAGGAALDTQIFAETGYGIFLNVNGSSSTGMVINSSGNVGIGTSSPNVAGYAGRVLTIGNGTTYENALELNGYNTTDDTLSDVAFLNGASSDADKRVCLVRANRSGANNSGALLFYTKNSGTFGERMRITSAGNVGIAGNAGSGRLQVWGEDQSGSNFVLTTYNSGGFGMFFVRNDGNIRTNASVYGNTTSGTTRTLYVGNGDFYLGGIASIRKSKKNIENVSNVDWLYQLNPVTFNYRKKDEDGNYLEETYEDLNYGLIAEDTTPIADFLINYNDKEDGTKEMVGIEYSRLITPLLKAIQEQNALIEELSAKVSALENKS